LNRQKKLIEGIYQSVNNLIDCLTHTLDFLENKILPDYASFSEISHSYHTNITNICEVLDGIGSLNTHLQQITNSVAEINSMIGQSSKGVEDVAEKNTNIVSLIAKTYDMVKENKNYAAKFQEIVDKFKL
jgi:methyl-accepting chemotaxis protein